ncbi:hypothetical protein ACJMK2_041423 [Sinanodonta woodiana]|uniref:Uncharacterized protein n=1 Tax=Sinanodonta woodiana TaxID=1069815 RepID=A0ABD3W463_SINWO
MNWVDSINYFIGKGKVQKVAIYDCGGKPLAATPELQFADQEVLGIIKCVNIPFNIYSRSQFGLFIGHTKYLCFKADDKTMIGLTEDDLFVAHICDSVMILAFITISVNADISCLGEVWTFAQELRSKMEVSMFVS